MLIIGRWHCSPFIPIYTPSRSGCDSGTIPGSQMGCRWNLWRFVSDSKHCLRHNIALTRVISSGGADTVGVFLLNVTDVPLKRFLICYGQTLAGLECFFLAMTLHTEEQKKAQAEIDKVIGSGKLPTLRDRESLPYTSALLTEVQRRYSFAMLGALHISA